MGKNRGVEFMKQIKGYVRGVTCEVCHNKLSSVYIRGKKFKSLKDYFYCENCLKIFKVGEENEKSNM